MYLRPVALCVAVFLLLSAALSTSPHAQSPFGIVRRFPVSSVSFVDWDGTLYGFGGAGLYGLTPDNVCFWDGAIPWCPGGSTVPTLFNGWTGQFYGLACGRAFSVQPDLQTSYTILHDFTADGPSVFPTGLLQGDDGNLYGITSSVGPKGTAFQLTPDGALTTIHQFESRYPDYGPGRPCALVEATDNQLYGTTSAGFDDRGSWLYRMTLDGTVQPLIQFIARGCSSLLQASDGNLYGVYHNAVALTWFVFRATLDGVGTVLFSPRCTVIAPLVEGPDGNFYAMTATPPDHGCSPNPSTILRLTPDGAATVVWTFDMQQTVRPLALGLDGALYGTGGDSTGSYVFRLEVQTN
jgi:hypothetical protein